MPRGRLSSAVGSVSRAVNSVARMVGCAFRAMRSSNRPSTGSGGGVGCGGIDAGPSTGTGLGNASRPGEPASTPGDFVEDMTPLASHWLGRLTSRVDPESTLIGLPVLALHRHRRVRPGAMGVVPYGVILARSA